MAILKSIQQKKQVFVLYASTVLGLFCSLLASIVNTDAISPSDYGDVRYVQNFIQMISWVLLFGYFLSGSRMLALSEDEIYRRRVRGCLCLILMVCSLTLVVCTFITGCFHSKATESWLFMASLPVCFYPLFINYLNTTAQGDNHIYRLSVARLLPQLLYVVVAYVVFRHCKATSALMILLQWGIYSVILVLIIASTHPSFRDLRPVFKELNRQNRSYGLLLYYGSIALVATSYFGGITLGWFNGNNTEVGFYTLAVTLTTPLSYLPAIVGTAYFRKFAHQSSIPAKVMRGTLLLTALSCIAFVVLIHPFIRLYKADYQVVATYASWLCVSFCVHGIGDMFNRYLGSHGQGRPIMISSFVCGAIKVGGFFGLVYLWNVEGALLAQFLSSCAYCLMLYYYYRKGVRMHQFENH